MLRLARPQRFVYAEAAWLARWGTSAAGCAPMPAAAPARMMRCALSAALLKPTSPSLPACPAPPPTSSPPPDRRLRRGDRGVHRRRVWRGARKGEGHRDGEGGHQVQARGHAVRVLLCGAAARPCRQCVALPAVKPGPASPSRGSLGGREAVTRRAGGQAGSAVSAVCAVRTSRPTPTLTTRGKHLQTCVADR